MPDKQLQAQCVANARKQLDALVGPGDHGDAMRTIALQRAEAAAIEHMRSIRAAVAAARASLATLHETAFSRTLRHEVERLDAVLGVEPLPEPRTTETILELVVRHVAARLAKRLGRTPADAELVPAALVGGYWPKLSGALHTEAEVRAATRRALHVARARQPKTTRRQNRISQ